MDDIERVVVCITSPSPRPDESGRYNRTALETTVRSLRNAPDLGTAVYVVDGYVFEDLGLDGNKDPGDTGLAGVSVRLGNGRTVYTNNAGYFSFRVPAGTYTLRHTPMGGFATFTSPDSFMLTAGPNGTYSFADTANQGGWVRATVWEDSNADKVRQPTEPLLSGVTVSVLPIGYAGEAASTSRASSTRLSSPRPHRSSRWHR